MTRARLRLFVVICATTILAGCGKEPLAPDADPSLAASPAVPANLTATAVSPTQINLAWRDMSTREDGFEMHRALGQSGTFSLLITIAPEMTTLGDAPLTPATEYCYKIRSFRMTGRKTTYSAFSNTACATTPIVPPPAAPSELNVRPADGLTASAYMTWKDNSTDEAGFRIERASSEQGPWESAAQLGANNTALYDHNRPAEQRLCYRVIAFRGQDESPSNIDCTYLPAGPTALTIAGASGQAIDLEWTDNSAVEDGFDVERSDFEWGPFASVGTTAADIKTFHDATVGIDKTYWYRVRVMREGAHTGSTNVVKAVTASAAPLAPSALIAVPSGSAGVSVYWTDNSGNETGFRVERSENGGATWVAAGTTLNTGFFDGGRSSDQQVCYRAIAFNTVGDSPPSNVDCTAPPTAPTNLVATTAPGLAIDLTWTDNSNVEDGYVVQRLFNDCYYQYYCYPYYATIATLGPNATSHRDAGLGPGEFHTYVVTAVKGQGNSDASNEASAYSELPPAAPSNLTAVAVTSTRIDLAWSDNSSNETNFFVSRCTGTEAACGDNFVGIGWAGGPDATTFSDTNAQPNTTYTYRIFSCNGTFCTASSNNASATTPP